MEFCRWGKSEVNPTRIYTNRGNYWGKLMRTNGGKMTELVFATFNRLNIAMLIDNNWQNGTTP